MKTKKTTKTPALICDGQSAHAFFHQGWNTWAVGIYVPGRAVAASYTTHATQAEAVAEAARFNALREVAS